MAAVVEEQSAFLDDANKEEKPNPIQHLRCSDAPVLFCASQALFLWCVTYSTFVPLLAFYSDQEGFGAGGIGLVSASLQVGWFIALPLLPWLASAVGSRRVLLLGVTSFAVSPLVVATSPGLWTLACTRAAEGFGMVYERRVAMDSCLPL